MNKFTYKYRLLGSLLILAPLLAPACKSGLQVDRLAIPDNLVVTGAKAIKVFDPAKIVPDYAIIDATTTTPDGYSATAATDPERILAALEKTKKVLFIRVPKDPVAVDNLMKTLQAASLRAELKNGAHKIAKVDLEVLNKEISTLGIPAHLAREYYVSSAKKINTNLTEQTAVIVNVDDLEFHMVPAEFLAELKAPKIIVLSTHTLDGASLGQPQEEVANFATGELNGGQIYSLLQSRLARSKGLAQNPKANQIALKITKVMTAMDPDGNLENLEDTLEKLEPIIEKSPLATNFEDEILNTLAKQYKVGNKYLTSLNLETKTLTEISKTVAEDRLAYNQANNRAEEMLTIIRGLPPSQVRKVDIELLRRQIRTMVENTEGVILDDAQQKRDELGDDIQNSERRLGVRNKQNLNAATETMKNIFIAEINKARRAINDHTTGQSVELGEQVAATGEDVKNQTRNIVGRAQNGVNANTNQAVKDAQGNILRGVKRTVGDTERALTDLTIEEAAKLQAEVEAAIRRMGLQNNAAVTAAAQNLRTNLVAFLTRTKNELNDATLAAADDVKEHQTGVGEDIKANTKTAVRQARDAVSANTDTRVRDAQGQIIKQVKNAIDDSVQTLSELTLEQVALVQVDLQHSLRRLSLTTLAQVNTAADKLRESMAILLLRARNQINDNTDINSEQIKAQIAQAEEEIKAKTKEMAVKTEVNVSRNTEAQVKNAQGTIIRRVKNAIGDTEQALSELTLDQVAQVQTDLTSTLRKLGISNEKLITTAADSLRQSLLAALVKVRNQVNDNTNINIEDLKADLARAEEALTATSKAMATKTQAGVNANTDARMREAVKAMKNAVTDNGQMLSELTVEQKGLVVDEVEALLRRLKISNLAEIEGATTTLRTALLTALNRVKNDIKNDAGVNLEEFKNELARAEDEIKTQGKVLAGKTQAGVNANTDTRVSEAQAATVKAIRNAITDNGQALSELTVEQAGLVADQIEASLRRLKITNQAEIQSATSTLRTALLTALNRAKNDIKNDAGVNVEEIKNELARAEDEIKTQGKVLAGKTQAGVNANTDTRVSEAQAATVKAIRNAITDNGQALSDLTVEQAGLVADQIEASLRRLGLTNKGEIESATGVLRTAMLGALARAKNDIKGDAGFNVEELKSELARAEDEIKANSKMLAAKARDDVNANTDARVRDAQGQIIKGVGKTVDEARASTEEFITQKLAESQADLTAAIRRVTALTEQRIASAESGINANVAKTAGQLKNKIEDVVAGVEEKIGEDGQVTRDEMGRLPRTIRGQTRDLMRQLGVHLSKLSTAYYRGIVTNAYFAAVGSMPSTAAENNKITNAVGAAMEGVGRGMSEADILTQMANAFGDPLNRSDANTRAQILAAVNLPRFKNQVSLAITKAPRPVVPDEWEHQFKTEAAPAVGNINDLGSITNNISRMLEKAAPAKGQEINVNSLRDRFELVFHMRRLDENLAALQEKAKNNELTDGQKTLLANFVSDYEKDANGILEDHRQFERELMGGKSLPEVNTFPAESTVERFNELQGRVKALVDSWGE
jgi:hypothetical protein